MKNIMVEIEKTGVVPSLLSRTLKMQNQWQRLFAREDFPAPR